MPAKGPSAALVVRGGAVAVTRPRAEEFRWPTKGGRRLGLTLFVLVGVLFGASCAVDFTNPNVPGGSISCNPTETQINFFYEEVLVKELEQCLGCHDKSGAFAGSYGFSEPADASDEAGKKDAYCYHFTKWDDNTLIDYPTSADHKTRPFSKSDLPNLAEWVQNRFQ